MYLIQRILTISKKIPLHGGSRISANINKENTTTDVQVQSPPLETEISTYSTTILDRAAGRLTNIRLTCNTLNNFILNPGDTFSFNSVVGEPTSQKGYQEAKIIVDHHSETGIGRW